MSEVRRIGALVLTVQSQFLEEPWVTLTPRQIQQRCGIDAAECRAILKLLVDGGVIERGGGRYVRAYPRRAARPFNSIESAALA
jgi:hypothetical protein